MGNRNRKRGVSSKQVLPKVVIGIDFGTSFSGFAYAKNSPGSTIDCHFHWPDFHVAIGEPYCKTMTSLLYTKRASTLDWLLEPHCWGWEALVKMRRYARVQDREGNTVTMSPTEYELVTRFKLHLANPSSGPSPAKPLPAGLTPKRVITDFLREIGRYCFNEVVTHVEDLTMEEVQWCLTVPAIWDDSAKQLMKMYTEEAGLTQSPHGPNNSGSPFPLLIVLEPEAASLYCQRIPGLTHSLSKTDKFLTVDAGGGTVDLVMHCKDTDEPSSSCHQVDVSDGGLCGGTLVDDAFFNLLRRKVPSFSLLEKVDPILGLEVTRKWHPIKHAFQSDPEENYYLILPTELRELWASRFGREYDEPPAKVLLTFEELRSIFDPTVDNILSLIDAQLSGHPDCKFIFMVGGFSMSEYLMSRVRERFSHLVDDIIRPQHPGAAVCKGAVLCGLNTGIFSCRISRRTYGITICLPFREGIDPPAKKKLNDNNVPHCDNRFYVFVRKGDKVACNEKVSHIVSPFLKSDTTVKIQLLSSTSKEPEYDDDLDVQQEGSFTLHMPETSCGRERTINVSLFFGKTAIEVTAKGENFDGSSGSLALPVAFAHV